jgi:Xaa-Pro aminopeptidase
MANEERLIRMRQAMEAERLDALVLRLPENVLLLSGFWPMIGACTLVFPLQGPVICVNPDCYEAEASSSLWDAQSIYYGHGVLGAPDRATAVRNILAGIAKDKGWRRIGYEGSFEVAAPSWNSAEFLVPAAPSHELLWAAFDGSELVDVSALLQAQRRRKTGYEIAKLRTASEISAIGLRTFERIVAVGISGVELAAAVERDIMVDGTGYNGATRVRAFAQVAAGPEESAFGYRPNEISSVW